MHSQESPVSGLPETLSWQGGRPGFVRMVEQTLLPSELVEIEGRGCHLSLRLSEAEQVLVELA